MNQILSKLLKPRPLGFIAYKRRKISAQIDFLCKCTIYFQTLILFSMQIRKLAGIEVPSRKFASSVIIAAASFFIKSAKERSSRFCDTVGVLFPLGLCVPPVELRCRQDTFQVDIVLIVFFCVSFSLALNSTMRFWQSCLSFSVATLYYGARLVLRFGPAQFDDAFLFGLVAIATLNAVVTMNSEAVLIEDFERQQGFRKERKIADSMMAELPGYLLTDSMLTRVSSNRALGKILNLHPDELEQNLELALQAKMIENTEDEPVKKSMYSLLMEKIR